LIMIKNFITILTLSFILFLSTLFAQNQKVLLLGECDKISTTKMLNYLDTRSKILLSIDNNIVISDDNISSYPIILICDNDYLKLNNREVSILGNHLKQGGLLILDNVISDYTFSIFLDKILPQSYTESISLDTLFSDNPFNINFDEVELDLEAIFINKKLSVLGIKKVSLINYWQEENEEFFKIGSSIIFYNLTR
ncbi:DUF4159 domain-containing protein, partial [bacterium]|nr:DUF4159 domain-containing protein [bacterium]